MKISDMHLKLAVLTLLVQQSRSFREHNVCLTFEDYLRPINNPNCYYNPDFDLSTVEIIQKYMGTVEIYNAITDDGYILPIYRIPRWKSKGTILLQHPLLSDSYVYVGQGNGSLAYLLWQNGYEIWLSNARGTRASRHQTLTQQDYQFWNFSFDEIGRYDTPKIINVIKSIINDTKIIYVGYSEASVIAYIYASLYPEEAQRSIRVFIIGGSCAIFKNYSSPLKFIAPAWPILQPILNSLKIGNLVPPLLVELLSFLVRTFPILATAASVFVDIICGWTRNADPSIFNTGGTAYLSDVPAKTLIHFAQLGMNNGHFRMFDYGVRRNQQYYHQRIPPEYPLEKISVPVYLIISRNDTLTTVEDTFEVYKKLPAEAQIYTVSVIVGLNHLDFFTGRNRKQKFYDLVVSFIKNNFN